MKVIKLRDSDLKDYPELLQRCNAVDGNQAYPQYVYLSDRDLKTLVINIVKSAKKEAPHLQGRPLQAALSYHKLNLEPNSSFRMALKPGFALVDDEAISKDIADRLKRT